MNFPDSIPERTRDIMIEHTLRQKYAIEFIKHPLSYGMKARRVEEDYQKYKILPYVPVFMEGIFTKEMYDHMLKWNTLVDDKIQIWGPKIYEWAVDCFISPYTKIGKKRLEKEYDNLIIF